MNIRTGKNSGVEANLSRPYTCQACHHYGSCFPVEERIKLSLEGKVSPISTQHDPQVKVKARHAHRAISPNQGQVVTLGCSQRGGGCYYFLRE